MGTVLQQISDFSDIDRSIYGVIPNDDTVPQASEGVEVISAIIDVKRPSSRLEISVSGVATSQNGGIITLAVFVGDQSSASAVWGVNGTNAVYVNISNSFVTDTIGTIGPVKVSVRVGLNDVSGGNYVTMGGRSGNVQWGDKSPCTLTIREVAGEALSWSGKQRTGNLLFQAPGIEHFLLIEPNGLEPTGGDFYSHRYHHHTRVVEHNGLVWTAYTTAGRNEDAKGMTVLVQSSSPDTISFSAPVMAFPYIETFNANQPASNGPGILPRNFQVIDGRLFLVGAVDDTTGDHRVGQALLAVECLSDGSVGVPFRVSVAPYTSTLGWSPAYDNVLSPVLLAYSKIFGIWGGSTPDAPIQSPWIGWVNPSGVYFTEPSTFHASDDPNELLRVWRYIGGVRSRGMGERLWISRSIDGGVTWGGLRRTDIPNVAVSTGIRLSNGKIALVGNLEGGDKRDPLYLGLFDDGELTSLFYVRQGLSKDPVYPGEYKIGAAAYPDIFEGENYIWVSYSNAKERIFVSRIPKSGL
ncbi:hypothetical protein F9K96_05610 [Brucella anthropi]|uniref:hypothetical protein n=1 Tax=Brucella anthropi TaxID=529 RepID=UPI00124C3FF8|nr:hypothetical protein [Brucella anthropi]KAB2792612.1 hypothetical protein F9K96_05610 [Brucella anthropi]